MHMPLDIAHWATAKPIDMSIVLMTGRWQWSSWHRMLLWAQGTCKQTLLHTAFNNWLKKWIFLLNLKTLPIRTIFVFAEYYKFLSHNDMVTVTFAISIVDLIWQKWMERVSRETSSSVHNTAFLALSSKIGVQNRAKIFWRFHLGNLFFWRLFSESLQYLIPLLFIVNMWSVRFCPNSWIYPLFICILYIT